MPAQPQDTRPEDPVEPEDHGVLAALGQRLHPRTFLRDLLPELRRFAPVSRVGVGLLEADCGRFRVLALATTDRVSRGGEGGTFPVDGTTAGWVCEHSRPFVGSSIRDVRPFAQTYSYFVTEQMQSNCLLPLPIHGDGGAGVAYFVSRVRSAFSSTLLPALENVRDAMTAQVDSYLRLLPAPAKARASDADPASDAEDLASLDEVQRRHIGNVLKHTDGVIEGSRGAAKILGLAPSTLRNRMRRLGLRLR